MKPVFLDTSGLVALTDLDDFWHRQAVDTWQKIIGSNRSMVTTSLVLVEIADGLAKVRFRQIAVRLVDALNQSNNIEVVHVTQDLESIGWQLFRDRPDKDWGMTDCVSMSLMKRLEILDVFGLDRHFEQAGFQLLLTD